jgi:hypothetical protein
MRIDAMTKFIENVNFVMAFSLITQIATFFSVIFLMLISSLNANAKIVLIDSTKHKIEISFVPKYLHQDFKWSIAGNLQGSSPNIYSELTWHNLQAGSVDIMVKWNFINRFIASADMSWALNIDGHASDIDYNDDNRNNPTFVAHVLSRKGNAIATNAALGYQIINSRFFRLTGFLGFEIHRQFYHLSDDFALNSSYKAQWSGPFIAFEPQFLIAEICKIDLNLSYYQVDYSATANWNLIEEFQHPVSFKHAAYGFGIETGIGLRFPITQFFDIYTAATYGHWSTGKGIDTLYLRSGEVRKTQLNDVTRLSWTLGIGASFFF